MPPTLRSTSRFVPKVSYSGSCRPHHNDHLKDDVTPTNPTTTTRTTATAYEQVLWGHSILNKKKRASRRSSSAASLDFQAGGSLW